MIKKKHEDKLNKTFNDFNKVMNEIIEYEPGANLFFNGEGGLSVNLHLKPFLGETLGYDDWYDSKCWSANIHNSDCGGY
jgi:hypothetical protein